MQRDNILVKKPNINICYADDPHLHFTFGEHASYQYNLFITNTNKGGGTKRVASPDNTVSFATPEYQNNTYLLGVTKKQKTFKHTLAADRLLPEEVDQILQWLKVGEVGFLSYDTNPYWGWDAIITSVGEVSEYENSDGMIIEFTVEFKTLNDWHARSRENATKQFGANAINGFYDNNADGSYSHTIANEFGIPEIIVDGSTIYLPQVCDEHSFVNIDWTIPTSGTIQQCKVVDMSKNSTLYDYTFNCNGTDSINYLGQYGFTLSGDQLVENIDGLIKTSNASELLILNNELPKQVINTSNAVLQNIGDFECKLYNLAKGSSWSGAKWEDTIAGNVYAVRIGIVTTYNDSNTAIITYWPRETPSGTLVATYTGSSNILDVTGTGTLTTIKHRSL